MMVCMHGPSRLSRLSMADLRCSPRKCLLFVIAAWPILGPKMTAGIKDCTEEGGVEHFFSSSWGRIF